jgi:hypothetical protein
MRSRAPAAERLTVPASRQSRTGSPASCSTDPSWGPRGAPHHRLRAGLPTATGLTRCAMAARPAGPRRPVPHRRHQDKGLLVITGCGHAGVINICRYARRLTSERPLYAVVGGFRPNGPIFEPLIPRVPTTSGRWRPASSCPRTAPDGGRSTPWAAASVRRSSRALWVRASICEGRAAVPPSARGTYTDGPSLDRQQSSTVANRQDSVIVPSGRICHGACCALDLSLVGARGRPTCGRVRQQAVHLWLPHRAGCCACPRSFTARPGRMVSWCSLPGRPHPAGGAEVGVGLVRARDVVTHMFTGLVLAIRSIRVPTLPAQRTRACPRNCRCNGWSGRGGAR